MNFKFFTNNSVNLIIAGFFLIFSYSCQNADNDSTKLKDPNLSYEKYKPNGD